MKLINLNVQLKITEHTFRKFRNGRQGSNQQATMDLHVEVLAAAVAELHELTGGKVTVVDKGA